MPELPNLRDAARVVFFTGAGLSVESGIPTYRGAGGIWHEYDYAEYACEEAFRRDPDKVWDFHDLRRGVAARAEPNGAHRLIAGIQRAKPGTVVITQNIDGLHERAGATGVIDLHGSLWRLRDPSGGALVDNREVPLKRRKNADGRYWRPDITWFGDLLDMGKIGRAERAIEQCDVLVAIGTSGVVYPAADLPRLALRTGAARVEINPEETQVSHWYEHHLRGPATEMLPRLWR